MTRQKGIVRKTIPVDFLDMDGIEGWLEDMAAQGLHYQESGSWYACFLPGEPARVRYHMEPPSRKSGMTLQEVEDCEAMGWAYAGKFGGFELFRTRDQEAADFHTDPVIQSYTLDRLSCRLAWGSLICLALTAALLAFLVFGALDSPFGPVLRLVKYSSLWSGLLLLVALGSLLHLCRNAWRLWQLRRRLRLGIPAPARRRWRRTRLFEQISQAVILAAAVLQIGSLVPNFLGLTRWEQELSTLSRPAPVLSLAELEGTEDYQAVPFGYPGYEGPDRDNMASYEAYPLARYYEVDQAGTADGADCRLDVEWYSLLLPFLAGPLLEDVMDYELYDLPYRPERYRVEELDAPGFDRLVLVRDIRYGGQQLFALAGRRVVYLDYDGGQDLARHLDQVRALLTWET